MDDSNRAQSDISSLHKSLNSAYRRRLTHIMAITAALFLGAAAVISGLALIIYREPKYGFFVVVASAFQVVVLIAVILGLVIHGMSVGRMTSMLVGILKTSIGLLQRDLDTLARELMPLSTSVQQVIDHINNRFSKEREERETDSPAPTTAREQQYLTSALQLRAILEELESTRTAAEGQLSHPDLAMFAYGFAFICVLSSAILFIGSTDQAEFPRVLMIGISLSCALSCFAVLRRPTGPQFLIEESLRKMGLSMDALTDSLRTRDARLPPQVESEDLVERSADELVQS